MEVTAARTRITVGEIAERLDLSERAIYEMLEQQIIPATRFKKRWLISRHAYEQWELTFETPKVRSAKAKAKRKDGES